MQQPGIRIQDDRRRLGIGHIMERRALLVELEPLDPGDRRPSSRRRFQSVDGKRARDALRQLEVDLLACRVEMP